MTGRPIVERAEPFTAPEFSVMTLENGFRAKRITMGSVPKVQARLVVGSGSLNEAANQSWIGRLAAKLLKEGAGTLDGAGLASAFAAMGGQLHIEQGEDVTTFRA